MFAGFMAHAWVTATIVATVAGAVGFFVVQRSSAFPAHAIPNGAFAGAAGATLIGVSTLAGLAAFAVAAALTIGLLGRRDRRDTVTALALVTMLALGAAFLSRTTEYGPQLFSLLFGELLGVSTSQLVPTAALAGGCLIALAFLYRPLLLSSALPQVAEARGLRTLPIDLAFLVVLALATAMTVPVVGALLMFSLMVGPPAAARLLVADPLAAMAASVVAALATVWASVAGSYLTNWPVGFFVGVLSAALYGGARAGGRLLQGRPRPRHLDPSRRAPGTNER
ncbi:MAG TPA: metal ABC transporter permease, partial [Acidimicrobiales bacterium]|nr:metal ABC transporter permease [Acidimicrobiales bacterium]